MPDQLTEQERRVLDYLVEYLRTHTYQPSIREIGREFAIKSTKTVSELLQALADKGWIERDPSRSRGVRLLGLDLVAQTVSVPVYEAADALAPSDQMQLDRRLVAAHGAFLLPMNGDHLCEDGIQPGDLLLVEPVEARSLERGDIVLARSAGTTAARRCARAGDDIALDPVRAGEVPLTLSARQAAGVIRGRITGVIRRLRQVVRDEPAAGITIPVA